ncbi:hypothetical protein ACFWAY_26050 [Rhodococcus sp. NPDC059968]|uniref:hypothetical protein n=1 Tax=Rhodococcus sp. NPDC059968 TaxID=3347017 RepID=UPI00366CE674
MSAYLKGLDSGKNMMKSHHCFDDDILDLAILRTPIGGPSVERIRSMFGIGASEYRQRLASAVTFHQTRLAAGTRANLDRVYGAAILAGLARDPDL